MARRWFMTGTGKAIGVVTIISLFALLSSLYGFEINDLTGDIVCEGTYENPCISRFEVRNPNAFDVDVYSSDQVKLEFSPDIKDYALFVPDGRCSATGKCACEMKNGETLGFKGLRCVDFTNKTKPRQDKVYNFRFKRYNTVEFTLAGIKNNPSDEIKWTFGTNDVELDPIWHGSGQNINYKNNNMTIEFKNASKTLGEATLKSHKTYDEIRKVPIGKNKIVIWYEFSGFKDIQEGALIDVEFIDMRREIFNYSGEEPIEESEVDKYIVPNPDYLLPIEKSYNFVYQDGKGGWLDYNSFNIPKENIIIGVQTDLSFGEFIDVQLNVFGNKLDKHALVTGISSGFVSEAPTSDPQGASEFALDSRARVLSVTSPAGAIKITEIGVYVSVNSDDQNNFEVGLYASDGVVVPGEAGTLLEVSRTNTLSTGVGWKVVTGLDWDVDSNTDYWLGIQYDDTVVTTRLDYDSTTGPGTDTRTLSTLPDPYGGGAITDTTAMFALYAVWEAAADSCTYTSGDWNIAAADNCVVSDNIVIDGSDVFCTGSGTFTIQDTFTVSNFGRRQFSQGCYYQSFGSGGFF